MALGSIPSTTKQTNKQTNKQKNSRASPPTGGVTEDHKFRIIFWTLKILPVPRNESNLEVLKMYTGSEFVGAPDPD